MRGNLSRWLFGDSKARPAPVEVKANRITWEFEWPAEVWARPLEADTRKFHSWVLELDDIDTDALSRRMLMSLYAEFVEVHDLRPMRWHRFNRSLKGAGFERHRASAAGRPWFYRAIKPGSALVLKLMPPANTNAHRAAA